MVAPGARRIDLKLLLITAVGDEPAFLAARSALDRIGVPYDVLIATTSTLTPAMLSNEIDHWGRDLSYDELITTDTELGLHYLLTGDIDPLMFHQGNLKSELAGTTRHSLLGDWVEASAQRFVALVNVPILTLAQRDIAAAMKARAALNACGVTATYVEGGASGSPLQDTVELISTGTCSVPLTGIASTLGTVETYAGVPTTELAMSPGVVAVVMLSETPSTGN